MNANKDPQPIEARYEYHLSFWGSVTNPDAPWVERDLGIKETNHWFSSTTERDEFHDRIKKCADKHDCRVGFAISEGWDTRLKTIARMTLRLPDGRAFNYEYDYGHGVNPKTAHYAWKEGNYQCDCNRSLFLKQAGHAVEEMECGDSIALENFTVTKE